MSQLPQKNENGTQNFKSFGHDETDSEEEYNNLLQPPVTASNTYRLPNQPALTNQITTPNLVDNMQLPHTPALQNINPTYLQNASHLPESSNLQPTPGLPPPSQEVLDEYSLNSSSNRNVTLQNNLIPNNTQTNSARNSSKASFHNTTVNRIPIAHATRNSSSLQQNPRQPNPTSSQVNTISSQAYASNNVQSSNRLPSSENMSVKYADKTNHSSFHKPLIESRQHANDNWNNTGFGSSFTPSFRHNETSNTTNFTKSKPKKAKCLRCDQIVVCILSVIFTSLMISLVSYFILKPLYYDPMQLKASAFSPSNGTWTDWSPWSECSRIIGQEDETGIPCGDQTRQRFCENREDGGNECLGPKQESRSCRHPECKCRQMTITGKVVDSNGESLERVKIFISGTTKLLTETDSYGKFLVKNLCDRNDPDGTVGIDLELRGFYPKKNFQVQPMNYQIQVASKSPKIQLIPATPPVIKESPQSNFRLKGQVVKMCCDVTQNSRRLAQNPEDIKINWYRNSIRLNSRQYKFNSTHPDLLIENLDPNKHQGQYECTASNIGGTTRSAPATLKVFKSENDLCHRIDNVKWFCDKRHQINVGRCKMPEIEGLPEKMCLSKSAHLDLDHETCENNSAQIFKNPRGYRGNSQRQTCCKPREQVTEEFTCGNEDDGFYKVTANKIISCSCQPCN